MSTLLLIACSEAIEAEAGRDFPRLGLDVVSVGDARSGLEALATLAPDAVVVAQRRGSDPVTEFLRTMQRASQGRAVPVIVVWSTDDPMDRIVALELGARDCMVEPVHARELYLRVRNALQGAPTATEDASAGRGVLLRIDATTRRIQLPSGTVTLSPRELEILLRLSEFPHRTWSREEIQKSVWGRDAPIDRRSVDACIKRMRAKLNSDRTLVETVWGEGYRLTSQVRVQVRRGPLAQG